MFLAHLSQRLIRWAYRIGRPLSSFVRCRRPHSLNIFSSETNGPISQISNGASMGLGNESLLKWSWSQDKDGHHGHICEKPKKSSSPEPKGQWPWILVCIIGCLSTTKFAQMVTLGWPWHILRQCQIWSLMLLYGKKVNSGFFRNYCLWFETGNRWPKWQEVSVDIKTLSPGGLYAPAPGLYTCIKSWKTNV